MKDVLRKMKLIILVTTIILANVGILLYPSKTNEGMLTVQYKVIGQNNDLYQLFYTNSGEWNELNSQTASYTNAGKEQNISYIIPKDTQAIRLDLGTKKGKVKISNVYAKYSWKKINIQTGIFMSDNANNQVGDIIQENDSIIITSVGDDPFIVINLNKFDINSLYNVNTYNNYILKGILSIIISLLICIIYKASSSIILFFKELYTNKDLIWRLAKNDFKTKYAGSYLGIMWAFVHPVITVLIYWFVFQVGFKSAPIDNFPFVLWLVSGIVPWFFFSDGLTSATNCMLEYSYLVKKVVFKISILPIVKIVSAFFVHIFFICFTVFLFSIYGYAPSIYMLQAFYYSLCAFLLILGITYATSAIIIFFKDLGQIITIILQIGMWMTPIMWSYSIVSPKYQVILKINPLYYIVEGYRDSFINNVWFWERYNQTIYFWVIAIICFLVGAMLFRKLKPHFADIL